MCGIAAVVLMADGGRVRRTLATGDNGPPAAGGERLPRGS
jgi:hypothetical protein